MENYTQWERKKDTAIDQSCSQSFCRSVSRPQGCSKSEFSCTENALITKSDLVCFKNYIQNRDLYQGRRAIPSQVISESAESGHVGEPLQDLDSMENGFGPSKPFSVLSSGGGLEGEQIFGILTLDWILHRLAALRRTDKNVAGYILLNRTLPNHNLLYRNLLNHTLPNRTLLNQLQESAKPHSDIPESDKT